MGIFFTLGCFARDTPRFLVVQYGSDGARIMGWGEAIRSWSQLRGEPRNEIKTILQLA